MDADSIQALDDAAKLVGAAAFFVGLVLSVRAGVRRWWHRKRDRQEQILRDIEERQERLLKDAVLEIRGELGAHSATVAKQLLDIGTDVTEVKTNVETIQANQLQHLTDHAKGSFRTA